MKQTTIKISILGILLLGNFNLSAQNKLLNKLKNKEVMGFNLKDMSLKSATTLKLMEKQFERLEKAIGEGDYRTSANNVKYIKKGLIAIKKVDPSLDVSTLESRLQLLESKIGPDPNILKQTTENATALNKQKAFENEKVEKLQAQQKEQRAREIAFAKQMAAQGHKVSRNAMGKAGPNVKLDFNSARV